MASARNFPTQSSFGVRSQPDDDSFIFADNFPALRAVSANVCAGGATSLSQRSAVMSPIQPVNSSSVRFAHKRPEDKDCNSFVKRLCIG